MKLRKLVPLLMTIVVAGLGTVPGSAASDQNQQAYPNAPTDLHITDSSRQTSLTAAWTAVTGASGYRVGRDHVALTDTVNTSYTWTGLTCGTTYTLSVQPETSTRDTGGHVAFASGTTASCGSSVSDQNQQAYPNAPTNLHITDSSRQTSLTAAWTAVTGASGYRVGRDHVALTDTVNTSYTWTGLTCGTTYTLSVQPETSTRDTGGHVAFASGTTASCGSSVSDQNQQAYPNAPTNLHITDSSRQTSLTAAWTAVTGASGYRVGRDHVALTDTVNTSYTWTGLTCGTTYTLSVQPETSTRDTGGHVAFASGTTASCGSSEGSGGDPVAFKGDFEAGGISEWRSTSLGGAQCLNYGQPSDSNSTRGNLQIVTDVVAKGRYGGRFDLPASGINNACELLRGRTIAMDDEWYSMEVRFPSNWQEPSPAGWGVALAQFNFENIWGSPLSVRAHANYVSLTLNSGLCNDLQSGRPSCQYSSGIGGNVPSQSIVSASDFSTGIWHQLLIHVKWTNGNDGIIEGFHRLRGQTAWTQTVKFKGYPTLQRTSTFTPGPRNVTVDTIGAYRGAAGFPLSVWQDNFCQATSRAAVETCF